MDRMIYTAMTGAKNLMHRQESVANNLANVNTPGYRATTTAFRVAPLNGPGLPTRAYAVDTTTGADFAPGTVQTTGRPLDVAVQGRGWLAVQGADGTEGYTRNGGFEINEQGVLQTSAGQPVLGDGGPITLQQGIKISIAADGTISGTPEGSGKNATAIGRLKLVNPPENELTRGSDGLFRLRDGAAADADPRVRVASGAIEGSNVNAVEAMVSMISLARQFDTQMKLLQSADGSARRATQLLSVNT
jgi:flagellar basal-body rod protein FlgF